MDLDGIDDALAGTQVVAAATNVPGPLAAARLAALGASVLKVEPPRGDPLQASSPAWYAELVEGMEVVRLDLSKDRDRQRLYDRLARSDVLVTAMRARALQRAGLNWTSLHDRHPRLVQVAIVGERAPHADRAGHDLTYQARAGLLWPPVMPRVLVGDLCAAERTVGAVLAALRARDRNRVGRYVEIGIVEAADAFAAPLHYGLTSPEGPLGGGLATYRLYPASDGWVAVAALEPHFIEGLRGLLGVETLDAGTIAAALARRTAHEWESLALERDVPLARVRIDPNDR